MNIAPLAISYEYDPCDYLKAAEFQLKRDVEGYKKTMQDDLLNMQTGILGYKGRVHFEITPSINDELDAMDRSMSKQELYSTISALIDRRIHANYRIYPCNYIAHDMLEENSEFAGNYTTEERAAFENYLNGQLAKIKIDNPDMPFLRNVMLKMYANPLKNHLEAVKG
jgi:acid stress-induced BolA-like protein IbaG/YrbA